MIYSVWQNEKDQPACPFCSLRGRREKRKREAEALLFVHNMNLTYKERGETKYKRVVLSSQ